ncbi:zf-HC2 domain-containing protein [candidate division KSB1 bacterium]|nr:zf-HC2 domain-containing protein [candidate division KSB1 bacterium]
MKSCPFEHLLVSYVQNELSADNRLRLRNHILNCDHCRNLLADFTSVDRLLQNFERKPIPKKLYRTYKKQLATLYEPESLWKNAVNVVRRLLTLLSSRAPALRVARSLAVLLIGILVGRYFFFPSQTPEIISEPRTTLTKDDIQFISDYVVKSELLLLTIANSTNDEPSEDDIFLNKDIAQSLLYKTAQVQRKAHALDDQIIITFLTHLELVLLEISNREDEEIRSSFQEIRNMVNEANMVQKSRRLQRRLEKTLSENV